MELHYPKKIYFPCFRIALFIFITMLTGLLACLYYSTHDLTRFIIACACMCFDEIFRAKRFDRRIPPLDKDHKQYVLWTTHKTTHKKVHFQIYYRLSNIEYNFINELFGYLLSKQYIIIMYSLGHTKFIPSYKLVKTNI